jgi:DNA primase
VQAEERIKAWFGLEDVIYSPSTEELVNLLKEEIRDREEEPIVIPLPNMEKESELVSDYLQEKRGYSSMAAAEIMERFNLGYMSMGYYRGRVIIPVLDHQGSQVTFMARDITGTAEKSKLYPSGSPISTLLFNVHAIVGKQVWVTEGVWDAIRLWCFGVPAVAIFGSRLSGWQAYRLIGKFEQVVLMFDGDSAGWDGMKDAEQKLSPYVDVKVLKLRYGDPAEMTRGDVTELRQVAGV